MGRTVTSPGFIKSLQRGTASGDGSVSISAVDTAKSVILLDGLGGGNFNSNSNTRGPRVTAFTATSFTVSGALYTTTFTNDTAISFSWQVVEYF